MADVADKIFDAAQAGIKASADATTGAIGAFKTGAEIAQRAEQIKQNRQKLQQSQQDLMLKKMARGGETLKTGYGIKDPKAQADYFKNHVPKVFETMGLQNLINPDAYKFMTDTETQRAKSSWLLAQVDDGKITPSQYIEKINDIEYMANLKMTETVSKEDLKSVFKITSSQRQAKATAANAAARIKGAKIEKETEREGRAALAGDVEVVKQTAKNYVKFRSGGGAAGLTTKIKGIAGALADMHSGEFKTGETGDFVRSIIPWLGDELESKFDSKQKATMDTILSAFRIKEQLDSQFSAKEAMIQFARQFDKNLPMPENIKKANRMLSGIMADVRGKVGEFVKIGKMTQKEADEILGVVNTTEESIQDGGKKKKQQKPNHGALTTKIFSGWDAAKKQRYADRMKTSIEAVEKQLKGN